MAASSKFAQAIWRQQLKATAIHLEWIANSGRPAHERIAHLLCEMFARAQHAGLCHLATCEFPPTQFDIACALGLTSVHVNRMLQQLRAEGLITLHGRKLVIDDVEGLNQLALFDSGYLHSAHGHP